MRRDATENNTEPIGRGQPSPRRHRLRRLAWVLTAFGGFALLTQVGARLVVANTTSSVDPGLYLSRPGWLGGRVRVGSLVSLRVPEIARPYFAAHASRPVEAAADWFLIKPVAAGPSDLVDTTSDRVFVNGRDLGPIYDRDDLGRELPRWRGRRTLGEAEWLLVSTRCPGSLDGRYFGPVRTADLEAVRVPRRAVGRTARRRVDLGRPLRRPPVASGPIDGVSRGEGQHRPLNPNVG